MRLSIDGIGTVRAANFPVEIAGRLEVLHWLY
jgi:hypothetical protein